MVGAVIINHLIKEMVVLESILVFFFFNGKNSSNFLENGLKSISITPAETS